ncbi:MAG: addiction module protein [Meiothermus sp.]|nr:addiction module protein [Meiothermus sp.]
MSKTQILEQALKLSLKERAELARELQLSVDEPTLEENEQLWLEVIGRRVEEIRSGKVKGIPWEEVMRDVRAG